MSDDRPLDGLKVLIVEDEYLLAKDMARQMQGLGAEVSAAVATLRAAEKAMREPPDGVLLDIRLDHEDSYAFAGMLRDRAIPFIFTTGFDASIVPEALRDAPRLTKPIEPWALKALAVDVFAAKRPAA